MQRALDSAIGLPSRSTNASWMLGLVTPPDVRSSLTLASWHTVPFGLLHGCTVAVLRSRVPVRVSFHTSWEGSALDGRRRWR
jgi:hypothetical protein